MVMTGERAEVYLSDSLGVRQNTYFISGGGTGTIPTQSVVITTCTHEVKEIFFEDYPLLVVNCPDEGSAVKKSQRLGLWPVQDPRCICNGENAWQAQKKSL
jgi:ABC-type cobalamin transport system permease subunit